MHEQLMSVQLTVQEWWEVWAVIADALSDMDGMDQVALRKLEGLLSQIMRVAML
jgi:hypothetical protein